MIQAALLHFTLEETQWEEDWSTLLSLASQPGSSLEQLHIFTLAHILRRPIIVYGVKYVKSFRGEDLGYARFEGKSTPPPTTPSSFLPFLRFIFTIVVGSKLLHTITYRFRLYTRTL